MRSARAMTAIAIATAALAAGCGGGSGHQLDAGFRAKVDAACQQAIDDKQGHPFPLATFDPRHATAQQLPTVGAYFAAHGDAQQMIDRLQAAGEPAHHAADWDRLRALVDQASANSLTQQRVAQAKDVPSFLKTLDVAQSLQKRIDALGPRLGFGHNSACGRYFG